MKPNDLTYNYAQLMRAAQQATSRKDAVDLINKATKLKETCAYLTKPH